MVRGFSGFGFPKAHGAAFGLLAYQSTWLRVHYAPEFLCALLNEQPMGFYPPDALVHEAQRRGIEVLPPDVNASDGRVHGRVGRATVAPAASRDRARLRARRAGGPTRRRSSPRAAAGGPFRDLGDLAARAGAGRPALELLAWSGACDALAGGDRRVALWRLGVATPGPARAGGHAARAAARPARRAAAAAAGRLGGDARRLRHDRPDRRARTRSRCCAPHAAARGRREPRPAGRCAHGARVRVGGARRRAPAPGHRERHRLHAARGRARDDQPRSCRRSSTSAAA